MIWWLDTLRQKFLGARTKLLGLSTNVFRKMMKQQRKIPERWSAQGPLRQATNLTINDTKKPTKALFASKHY